jgi:gliding motility-associated-like protein
MILKITIFNVFLFFSAIFISEMNSEILDSIYLKKITKGIKSKEELIFADFFSPNGDGHNDTFVVKNINEYPINKMHIFNRWGEIVFTSEPYKNDWDGTMNVENQWFGKVLPEGIYFYRFEYIIGDFLTQANGKIILKR